MLRVLTRQPSPRMSEAELTHLAPAAIDFELAHHQHASYRAAMSEGGARLIDLPALDAFPDSSFVEDVLIALPELFVLCRPGAESRRGEVDRIAPHVPDDRPVLRIEAPATIDGGDVLVIERDVFVGLSSRTNRNATEALAAAIEPHGYTVHPIPLGPALHLKTAVTAPVPDLVVLNPRWVEPSVFAGFRQLEVDEAEPFAGNTLRVGSQLFVPAAHPRIARALENAGVPVRSLEIGEFAKAEAGLTCLSVVIPPPV